jgi:predicted anti-sigma-YlaC factor YlaD
MMMDADCRAIREDLDAFVDGELPGALRLRVSQHVERCSACAEEVQVMGDLGELLRHGAAAGLAARRRMDGLASGVVTLSRAQWAESWRGLVDRACADWHWAIVGVGSVAATFVSTLFVSAILAFGPVPERDDSLSAVMNNRGTSAGFLYAYATPAGENRDAVLLQLNRGAFEAPTRADHFSRRRPGGPRTTAELVGDLNAAVARQGRVVAFHRMAPRDRQHAEALLNEISRRMVPDTRPVGVLAVSVEEIRLITSTSVTARGL